MVLITNHNTQAVQEQGEIWQLQAGGKTMGIRGQCTECQRAKKREIKWGESRQRDYAGGKYGGKRVREGKKNSQGERLP